ncbi:unnamed protein product [Prorocentrum cordatum]|uniref:Uncharacterized protein n=1 Tax=Prorocentrum cordatum TaxID=2364126 RepID=A0ABN9VN97_9DINO|nr:unnamed protein product [Polarella glacialis]
MSLGKSTTASSAGRAYSASRATTSQGRWEETTGWQALGWRSSPWRLCGLCQEVAGRRDTRVPPRSSSSLGRFRLLLGMPLDWQISDAQFGEKTQTVVRFDWDDTLLPITCVKHDLDPSIRHRLQDQVLRPPMVGAWLGLAGESRGRRQPAPSAGRASGGRLS